MNAGNAELALESLQAKKAFSDLEGQYYILVNLWCQAHCISLLLKVTIPMAAYIFCFC